MPRMAEGLDKVSPVFLFNDPETAILDLRKFLLHCSTFFVLTR